MSESEAGSDSEDIEPESPKSGDSDAEEYSSLFTAGSVTVTWEDEDEDAKKEDDDDDEDEESADKDDDDEEEA